METIQFLFDFILHIDKHLQDILLNYQTASYAILCLIIFVETGLVIMPLLPGDSLLFAAGAIVASIGVLNIWILIPLLIAAAIIGDNTNYFIGKYVGDHVLQHKWLSKLVKKEYITKTENYFEKYGSRTIVIARFVPIVRTIAPFVAGVGEMKYLRFLSFSVGGGILWVTSITLMGYHFGNYDIVKKNFELVVFGIIGISLIPVIIGVLKAKFSSTEQ